MADSAKTMTGPAKGEFIAPPPVNEADETKDALPAQEEFWRPPARFGSVPVEKEPLGWDKKRGFRKLFSVVSLPFQVVERVQFGHPELEPNRLFWGDNLHIMRQLPSESIDLIYIDPPFFSGRNYNMIFGDQNELRSFSDIWEGGMPGFMIWLNARLYEMKRVLKKGVSIYLHLDWHAVHYAKVEMDKIFGSENFVREIIWRLAWISGFKSRANNWIRNHETILYYTKGPVKTFNKIYVPHAEGYERRGGGANPKGIAADDVWMDKDVYSIQHLSFKTKMSEYIGYPTQKRQNLVQRIIDASSKEGDVVADFFGGGGTTAAAATALNRRWIACDQSRVAVALTADRITRQVEETTGRLYPVPDFTVEHWGVYESARLAKTPPDQFRAFVLRAFGAVDETDTPGIHGMKGAVPVWVGEPDQKRSVTAKDVADFANAVRGSVRYQQDNLRDGVMLAWAFRPDARAAAERLKRMEKADLDFIRLDQVPIDSPRFREHVSALSTTNADYANFLTFVSPPRVEVGWKRLGALNYRFDASESIVMNAGAKIINVQWDFDYGERFSSTPGHAFTRGEEAMTAEHAFPKKGWTKVAAKVQDDLGGEGLWVGDLEVK